MHYRIGVNNSLLLVIKQWQKISHANTYPKCATVKECVILDGRLRDEYIPGISRYNDISQDGSETITESFVEMRKRSKVPDKAKKLENQEVQRKCKSVQMIYFLNRWVNNRSNVKAEY